MNLELSQIYEYSIEIMFPDALSEVSSKKVIKPMEYLKKCNNLDIIDLENFINIYNDKKLGTADKYNYFSLNNLVEELSKCCSIYTDNSKSSSVEPDYENIIEPGYIKEKISEHFLSKKLKKKLLDYFQVLAGDSKYISKKLILEGISEYNDSLSYSSIANNSKDDIQNIIDQLEKNSKEEVNFQQFLEKIDFYTKYSIYIAYDNTKLEIYDNNPLKRIYGLLILDDHTCNCLNINYKSESNSVDSILTVVTICANTNKNSDKKGIGSYLLLFSFIKAYLQNYTKIILEVVNKYATEIPEQCYNDINDVLDSLYLKFEEIKLISKNIIRNINDSRSPISDNESRLYWIKLKKEIPIMFPDALFDKFILSWKEERIDKDLLYNDLSKEFTWPNGYPKDGKATDDKPRGNATQLHFLNQIWRIPTNKITNPTNILQIAYNLGQLDNDDYDDYDLYDFIDVENINDNSSIKHEDEKSLEVETFDNDDISNSNSTLLNRECCDISISNNILCDKDDSEQDDSEPDDSEPDDSEQDDSEQDDSEPDDVEQDDSEQDDSEPDDSEQDDSEQDELQEPYDYLLRVQELNQYNLNELLELAECYNIEINKPIKKLNSKLKNEMKNNIILEIILFEFWQFEEVEQDKISCDTTYDIGNCNPDVYNYLGINYLLGKNSNQDLYCKFYEKHGFRENPNLNTLYKCFDKYPLPSMELDLYKSDNPLFFNDLLESIFIKRIPHIPYSEYCKTKLNS